MSEEVPKTGDIVYQITIDKGIVTKSNPIIVMEKLLKYMVFQNG